MPCADDMRGYGSNEQIQRSNYKCKHAEYWNELQKKMKIVKPGDNVMVPVPDLDRTKIDAQILPVLIVEEYSNGQFKLGTKYIHSNSCFEQNTVISQSFQGHPKN